MRKLPDQTREDMFGATYDGLQSDETGKADCVSLNDGGWPTNTKDNKPYDVLFHAGYSTEAGLESDRAVADLVEAMLERWRLRSPIPTDRRDI